MQIAAGILALVAGIAFPLAMVFWLNARLGRKPSLRPVQVGLVLTLNFVLPMALITSGLALLSPKLAEVELVRIMLVATWLAVALILGALGVQRLAARSAARSATRIQQG